MTPSREKQLPLAVHSALTMQMRTKTKVPPNLTLDRILHNSELPDLLPEKGHKLNRGFHCWISTWRLHGLGFCLWQILLPVSFRLCKAACLSRSPDPAKVNLEMQTYTNENLPICEHMDGNQHWVKQTVFCQPAYEGWLSYVSQLAGRSHFQIVKNTVWNRPVSPNEVFATSIYPPM